MSPFIYFFIMFTVTLVAILTNIIWDWITPKSKYAWLFMTLWLAGFVFSILKVLQII